MAKQSADKLTAELPGLTRGRGRPRKANPMSAAERMRNYRIREALRKNATAAETAAIFVTAR